MSINAHTHLIPGAGLAPAAELVDASFNGETEVPDVYGVYTEQELVGSLWLYMLFATKAANMHGENALVRDFLAFATSPRMSEAMAVNNDADVVGDAQAFMQLLSDSIENGVSVTGTADSATQGLFQICIDLHIDGPLTWVQLGAGRTYFYSDAPVAIAGARLAAVVVTKFAGFMLNQSPKQVTEIMRTIHRLDRGVGNAV
jgi:hypothetical protein